MIRKKGFCVVLAGLLVMAAGVVGLLSQEKEDLLFEEIPVAISASRREQPITESPSAVTLITAEDIRLSGAATIPDVLRRVAGVDVMSVSFRDQQVSIRGLNSSQSNKLLVLADGRSVYLDLYGNVMWDMLPVSLPEIERIEIVKSPISSLYGANAYCGVINIITYPPEKIRGARLHFTVGGGSAWNPLVIGAGGGKRWRFKVSASRDVAEEYIGGVSAGSNRKFNGLVEYETGAIGKVSLSLGHSRVRDRKIFVDDDFGESKVYGEVSYFQLNFRRRDFTARGFYTRLDADLHFPLVQTPQPAELSTWDIELSQAVRAGGSHVVLLGFNYRHNISGGNRYFPLAHHQNLIALFAEDQFLLSRRVKLAAGVRYDRHPLAGVHLSPRVNVLYTPHPRHTLRFSASHAFRNPAFINSYLDVLINASYSLPDPFPPFSAPFLYHAEGNTRLESESIFSYELGWLFRGGDRTEASLNLFYNEYENFLTSEIQRRYYGEGELFPGSPGNVFLKSVYSRYVNGGDARGFGGEASFSCRFDARWKGSVNYAYVAIIDKTDAPGTLTVNEANRRDPANPEHKVNGLLSWRPDRRWSVSASAHWTSATRHLTRDLAGRESCLRLPACFLINGRVGFYVLKDQLELFVSVFHLTNTRSHLAPYGFSPAGPYGLPAGRRIYGGFSYRL